MKIIKRRDEVATIFEEPIRSQLELDTRRAKSTREQAAHRRRNAVKGTGAVLTAALIFSGAPHNAATEAGQGVKEGATVVAENVETFGQVTGENLNGVLATVKNQIDTVLDSEQEMHDGNADGVGLTEADRQRLGRQAVEVMRQGETVPAEQSQIVQP